MSSNYVMRIRDIYIYVSINVQQLRDNFVGYEPHIERQKNFKTEDRIGFRLVFLTGEFMYSAERRRKMCVHVMCLYESFKV